ncbi:MAG: PH domain-containing protein [Acidimicrobiia bacterium]|nr:PH domain-containing protein [Acidimicrobiia bacterium]
MTADIGPGEPRQDADGQGPWHRLHPGTILDDALQRIPSVLLGLFLIFTSGGDDAVIELIQLAIGFAAIFPVVIRYMTGRYRITPELLQWRVGLFTKVHTDLPRHRIQSVDTRISVVGRVLGLQSVVVSSAGGEGEIRIGLIDAPTADHLRAELTPDVARTATSAGGDVVAAEEVTETELAALDASDLPRVVAVDVGRVLALIITLIAGAGIIAGIVTGVLGPGSIIFGLPLVLGALGIGRGIVTEAIGFSSGLRADRIHVSRGIFARSTLEAPLARVQGVTVKRTIVARTIDTERISVDTADVSGEGSRNPGQAQTLVHPIATQGTWRRWAETFLRGSVPDQERFRRVARVSLRRRWLAVARLAIGLVVVLAFAFWITDEWIDERVFLGVALAVGLAIPLALGGIETLRYRNERWALGEDQVAFRGGALTTTLVAIPRIRAQGTMISANWFQRRHGIANLTVDTASPTVGGTGRDLHLDDASDVAAAVLTSADQEGGV